MTTSTPSTRLAYDDPAPIGELWSDARRCGARLRSLERAAGRATGPVPSIAYDDQPRETEKVDITITAAAQRLANALSLHLD